MPPVSEERLAELTDRLESGIKDLYASGRYADYLAAMSKFHSYSYGNALLILFQCPTATNVAGYNTWKNVFDRQVKRGEKGIQESKRQILLLLRDKREYHQEIMEVLRTVDKMCGE